MKQIIKLVLIFLFFSQVLNQCIVNSPGDITIDQGTSVVCLHIMHDGVYNRTYAFRLNVDYFQALVISGLANHIQTKIPATVNAVSIDVQFQNDNDNRNQTIQIYNKTGQRYRDIISFVIIVSDGAFSQINVDNQKCDNLGSNAVCYQNQGFTKTPSDNSYAGKDPRIFVSWMGSDINKNHFISHTRRLSRYSSFSVGSIWNDAKNVINA